MKKFTKLMALMLALCMFTGVLLACNDTNEPNDTDPTGTNAPTESSTTPSTSKPTNGSTSKPTSDPVPDDFDIIEFYDLLDYNGKDFDEEGIDIGQGSLMYVVKDTDAEEYEDFKEQLADAGCYLYTSYEEGDHKYATFLTKYQILHTMLLHYDYDEDDTVNYSGKGAKDHYEVRVMEDDRETFGLAGLEKDNVYEETCDGLFMLLSDDADTWPGRMGFLYQLADGSFFIIDGGCYEGGTAGSPATIIMNVLKEHAPDPDNIVIAGWLFTHIHYDHVGAFYDIANKAEWRDKLTIEKVIYNMPSDDEMAIQDKYNWSTGAPATEGGMTLWGNKFNESLEKIQPLELIKAHTGQQLFLRDLTLTIDIAQDTILYSNKVESARGESLESINWHNSISVTTRVKFKDKTFLYLGDAHRLAITYATTPLFRTIYADVEIVQTAHHGYHDTLANILYKYLSPEIVIWPVMSGHYNGLNPDGSDYYENGNKYTGVIFGSFNDELTQDGIKQVYPRKNICEVCDDFETWEFKSVDYVK